MTGDGNHESLITSINAKIIKRFCINSEHCVSFFIICDYKGHGVLHIQPPNSCA